MQPEMLVQKCVLLRDKEMCDLVLNTWIDEKLDQLKEVKLEPYMWTNDNAPVRSFEVTPLTLLDYFCP